MTASTVVSVHLFHFSRPFLTGVLVTTSTSNTRTGILGDFKIGAFKAACDAGATVVPITIIGTGALMPSGADPPRLDLEALTKTAPGGRGRVRVIVHDGIPASDPETGEKRTAAEMRDLARDAIASRLCKLGGGKSGDATHPGFPQE